MKCPKCGAVMDFHVTTRLYREGGQLVPVVVSYYRCKCGREVNSELRKKYFCSACGRLSYGRVLCEGCQAKK